MKKTLILSAHDFRTDRRTSIHFLAEEIQKTGQVRFFSLRYSWLSKLKKDFRGSLDSKSNRIENFKGVECYLWKTLIHPFNTRKKYLTGLEYILFKAFQRLPNKQLVDWIKDADVIVFESGTSIIYFELAKKLNPNALFIYRASDDLDTINVARFVKKTFLNVSKDFDQVCLLAPLIAKNIPYKDNLYYVPNGVSRDMSELGDPNPYEHKKNAVSVGSMLFDLNFVEILAPKFPDITFHLIGTGIKPEDITEPNVIVYDHMAFNEVLRYIKHADIGLAPYITDEDSAYLADSSMKMLQYDFFRLPTVAPKIVVGNYPNRFGYIEGDEESIKSAMELALDSSSAQNREVLFWDQVVARLINPQDHDSTHINMKQSDILNMFSNEM